MATVNFAEALSQVGSVSGQKVPEGLYDLEVTKSEATTTRTGKLQFRITSKVLVGDRANSTVNFNVVFTPPEENSGATWHFFRKMTGLGIPESVLKENPDPVQVAQQLLGKRYRAQVSYTDEGWTEVDNFQSLEGGASPVGVAPPQPQPQAPAPVASTPPAAPVPQPPTAEEPF